MQRNMQSKGKKLLIFMLLVLAAGVMAALFAEPQVARRPVEEVLDAGSFTK